MLLLPASAAAHGVSYQLRGDGRAHLTFRYDDGSPMANDPFVVFAPGAGTLPTDTGVTDAAGNMTVAADHDGDWRIEVRDTAGHASRARITMANGAASAGGQRIPDWLAATSLFLNVVLGLWLASRSRGAGERGPATPNSPG